MAPARTLLLTGLLTLGLAAPAFADATAFVGANTTPANRQTRGFSIGISLLIVGFEFEYANTTDDPTEGAPSLKTGSGNLYVQPPFDIYGVRPYFTTGAGVFSETLGDRNDKGFALNTGGGVTVGLAGPLRLRVDYRVFKLDDQALHSPVQRIYAGLNLRF